QLRELSFTIIHSSTKHLPAWRNKCKDHNLPERIIPRDVATRWNSTHDMLKFALEYTTVIDDMTGGRDNPLRKFELTGSEWRIARDLVAVLKDATVFFSSDQIASISSVIPTMDKIDEILTKNHLTKVNPTVQDIANETLSSDDDDPMDTLSDDDIHPAVKMALLLAKKTMNRYYGRTDESDVYRIAMSISFIPLQSHHLTVVSLVLHPGLKLAYFR
ncbi:hypothetical protein DFH06DRAFT_920279, partial [Mycena polygramma]